MNHKVFAYCNVVAGILLSLTAVPVSLVITLVLLPVVVTLAVMESLLDMLGNQMKTTYEVMQLSFRMVSVGMKRLRGTK